MFCQRGTLVKRKTSREKKGFRSGAEERSRISWKTSWQESPVLIAREDDYSRRRPRGGRGTGKCTQLKEEAGRVSSLDLFERTVAKRKKERG